RLNIPAMLAIAPPVTAFADWLDGTNNAETLNGLGGNDTLDGGLGADSLFGGTGDTSKAFLPAQTSPLSFIDIGFGSAPAFADFDNDGDLDLLVGRSDGALSSFRRNADGSFTPMDGVGGNPTNPFAGIDVGTYSVPSFTDFDLNGTLDLVVGRNDGSLSAYRRNTDGSLTPMDGAGGNPSNPFHGINVVLYSAPSFSDLDLYEDQDMVIGRSDGTLSAFRRNVDGSYTPMDGLNRNTANPFAGIDVGLYSIPTFADLDGDADQDLVVGGSAGTLVAFRRNVDGSYTPMNSLNGNPADPFAGISVGYDSAPVFADLNGDSMPDLVVGSGSGTLSLYVLTTTNSNSDSLAGGNGADTLDGADGADTLAGGSGNDLFIISDTLDLVIETANGGADTIITSVSMTMPDQIEALRIAANVIGVTLTVGAGNDMLIGNGLANNFIGGAGDDVILAGTTTLADIYALFAT
ncbi:MAG: FG-GAP-like repeat-containing protein, partial [Alphaproteobacteria bacterium]